MGGLPDAARDTGLLIEGFPQTINFQNSPGEAVDDRGSGGAMLTNTIEIGTARLTTRRVTLTARTAVSPRATPNSPAGPGTPSAPARRPSRFPALACVLALAVLATPALAQTDATNTSTVPGPPTGLLAAAGHGGRSDLSWTAPASDGGDPPQRLQDRGLLRHRRVVDRPRRHHRRRQHNLLPHRARRCHHPPLPRLRHQHQRHRRRLQRRQRHHLHHHP